MTEVRFYEDSKEFSIEIKGHAGYAEMGSDIVCSAISILIQTLESHMDVVAAQTDSEIRDGYCWVYAKGDEAIESFRTILTGFRLIEAAYPEYISIEEGCTLISSPKLV